MFDDGEDLLTEETQVQGKNIYPPTVSHMSAIICTCTFGGLASILIT